MTHLLLENPGFSDQDTWCGEEGPAPYTCTPELVDCQECLAAAVHFGDRAMGRLEELRTASNPQPPPTGILAAVLEYYRPIEWVNMWRRIGEAHAFTHGVHWMQRLSELKKDEGPSLVYEVVKYR